MSEEQKENGRVSDTLNSLVRYDLVGDYDDYIDEISDGDYVKFEDVRQMLSNA